MTEAHDRSAGVLEKGGVVRFARDFFRWMLWQPKSLHVLKSDVFLFKMMALPRDFQCDVFSCVAHRCIFKQRRSDHACDSQNRHKKTSKLENTENNERANQAHSTTMAMFPGPDHHSGLTPDEERFDPLLQQLCDDVNHNMGDILSGQGLEHQNSYSFGSVTEFGAPTGHPSVQEGGAMWNTYQCSIGTTMQDEQLLKSASARTSVLQNGRRAAGSGKKEQALATCGCSPPPPPAAAAAAAAAAAPTVSHASV